MSEDTNVGQDQDAGSQDVAGDNQAKTPASKSATIGDSGNENGSEPSTVSGE